MKAIKYLCSVALVLGLSAPVMAQETDYGTALEPISKALKANPSFDAVKGLVKDYQKNYKKDPAALVSLGNTFLSAKLYDQANAMADLALKRDKNYGDAFILKGDIEAMKDEGGDAAMWYNQCMQLDPKNPTGYLRYASVYRKRAPEEAAKALDQLRTILPDYPVDAEAGHSFYVAEKYDKAWESYSKSNMDKLDEYKLSEYAIAGYVLSKFDDSYKVASFGAKKFPKNITLNRVALWNAVDLKKYPEAIEYAKAVLACDGDKSTRDYMYYGNALLASQQWQDAITQFEAALKLDPNNAEPLEKLSEAYTGLGQEDKALDYSEQYMSKAKNISVSDYARLAGIYTQKGNYDKAISVYESIAQKFPSVAGWAYLLAGSTAAKADKTEAKSVPYYEKIVSLLENKADRDADETGYLKSAYQNLGYYYWGTKNDLEAAKPYYEKLYKLDPNDKGAKAALGIKD